MLVRRSTKALATKGLATKVLALAALCAATASNVSAQDRVAAHQFSAAKMAAAIEATMKPEVVAFSYTIAKDGQVALQKGVGPARIALDGYRQHGPMQRHNIASVTKTFTALAILQLIEANRAKGKAITVNTKIGPYLPDGWSAGANVADLSFAELMRHSTGFSSGNLNGFSLLGYEGIRKMVAAGTTPKQGGAERDRAYDNANYALLRELMPKLWAGTGEIVLQKVDGSGIYKMQGDYTSALYNKYVNDKIFEPIGIKDVYCSDNGAAATLYYPLQPTVKGVIAPDQSKFCGSGGMYLATNEMARFSVYLFNTDKLLPAAVRKEMMDKRLGLDGANTSRGLGYSRNGIVGVGSNSQGKGGTKACMIHLPGGVDASLVQNSPDNAKISPCSVLVAAYEAGWK
jgi:CubicO group peptidase (beta-lactamase class C family)